MSEVAQPDNPNNESLNAEAKPIEELTAAATEQPTESDPAANGPSEQLSPETSAPAKAESQPEAVSEGSDADVHASEEAAVAAGADDAPATETPASEATAETATESSDTHSHEATASDEPQPQESGATPHEAVKKHHEEHDSIFASDEAMHAQVAQASDAAPQAEAGSAEPAKESDSPITLPPEVLAECKAKTLGRLLEESQRKATYVTNLISLLEEGATDSVYCQIPQGTHRQYGRAGYSRVARAV